MQKWEGITLCSYLVDEQLSHVGETERHLECAVQTLWSEEVYSVNLQAKWVKLTQNMVKTTTPINTTEPQNITNTNTDAL